MSTLNKHEILQQIFSKHNCIISIPDQASLDKIYNLVISKNYVEPTNPMEHEYFGLYYQYIEINYDKMKELYLKAIEHNNLNAANNLGVYYHDIKDYDQMKNYYSMGIEQGHSHCMKNFGVYYYNTIKDYEQTKKYWLMSAELGNGRAMFYLGIYYETIEKNETLMVEYYLKAFEVGSEWSALLRLAGYHIKKGEFKLALDLYMKDVIRFEKEIGLIIKRPGVLSYFLSQYVSLQKENTNLKQTNADLKLENTHLKFMPGSIGEKQAKDHFNELLKHNE